MNEIKIKTDKNNVGETRHTITDGNFTVIFVESDYRVKQWNETKKCFEFYALCSFWEEKQTSFTGVNLSGDLYTHEQITVDLIVDCFPRDIVNASGIEIRPRTQFLDNLSQEINISNSHKIGVYQNHITAIQQN